MSQAPKNIQSVSNNPLTRDMAFCFIYQNSKFIDVGPRRYRIKPASKVLHANFRIISESGTGLQGADHGPNSEDNYWEIETNNQGILSNLADCSYFVWVSNVTSSDDAPNGDTTYCERPSGTPIWKFTTHGDSVDEGTPSFVHRDNSSNLTRVHCTTSIEDGGMHLVGFTKKGTALRYFVDGKFTNSATLNGNDTLTTDDPCIGADLTGVSTTGVNELMYSHYAWARALSDEEAHRIYDPTSRWDIFPKDRPIAWVAAPGGSFTLAADTAAYTVSGTALDLDKSSLLAADTVAYTYTGTALDLNQGFTLVASTEAYSYTGTALDLTYAAVGSFTLTADTGTYTYTGTAASITKDLVLTADTVAYSYTGTALSLNKGSALTADTDSYSYTGTNLRLIKDILALDTVSYTYQGASIDLAASGQVWTNQPDTSGIWTTQTDDSGTWTIQ